MEQRRLYIFFNIFVKFIAFLQDLTQMTRKKSLLLAKENGDPPHVILFVEGQPDQFDVVWLGH